MMPVQEIELSGSDYFLFAMARIARAAGGADSPCRLLVRLDGEIELSALHNTLNRSPVLNWMTGAQRTRKLPFTVPSWQSNNNGKALKIGEDSDTWQCLDDNCSLLHYERSMDSSTLHPPLTFAIGQTEHPPITCILNWHHTLMDAHGAELLLQHLGRDEQLDNPDRLLQADGQVQGSRLDPGNGFFKRLAYARKSVLYITETSRSPIAKLKQVSPPDNPVDQYFLVRFTRVETEEIQKHCESMGLSHSRSLFFLGATVRALHSIQVRRGDEPAPYLVPVPMNLRKKGASGPAFSNNVSFLFFRIAPEELQSFTKTLDVLRKQLREQVAEELPYSYLEMMNLLRRLPLPMYAKLLSGPTRGQIASFFFSFTGDCCPDMNTFLGVPVREIIHLAPATTIPGLSVVFMRHSNSLKAVLSLRDSLLSKDELRSFEEHLRHDLLDAKT